MKFTWSTTLAYHLILLCVFQVIFKDRLSSVPVITANCSCVIGLSGACGHIVGLLYQLAKYKILGQKALPEDIAKTSQPQTWHAPRGEKLIGKAVQDIEVRGYSRATPMPEKIPRSVRSTLYNPVRGEGVDWKQNLDQLSSANNNLLIFPALRLSNVPSVSSKFGLVPKGSILSYQQKLESGCMINLYGQPPFPDLPLQNFMQSFLSLALSSTQTVAMENLKLSGPEIKRFEEQTRLQSQSGLWYKIRSNRITASKVGDIYRRRKDHETLAKRLKSTRHVTTLAMRQGLAFEPVAAEAYAQLKEYKLNMYPCGVVVNFWCPWLAASPDRKLYNPDMFPEFGLLEIKCPQVSSVLECKYLSKDQDGFLKLKRNHAYYYQVLTQLAVTGLEWCDFFVWCAYDHHLETIYFNEDVWQQVKHKVDDFYFSYFL